MSDTFHLLSRNGSWYYRRRVPEHLIAKLGRRVLQESLNTKSKAEAKKLRSVWDLEADALFARAETGALLDAAAPDRHQLPLAALIEHVRAHVEHRHRRFEERYLKDHPATKDELTDARIEVEKELAELRNPESVYASEWISRTHDEVVARAGGEPESSAVAGFVDSIRRALIELGHRRQDRYGDEFSRGFHDPLFDPAHKPIPTFASVADQYLAEKLVDAEVNGIGQKRIDKIRANIRLLGEIVGDDTPIAAVGYDTCQRVRVTLAKTPANRTKLFPGLGIEAAIELGETQVTLPPTSPRS